MALPALPAIVAQADGDVRVGSLRAAPPHENNAGTDGYGIAELRFVVENTGARPAPLSARRVVMVAKRVTDDAWRSRAERLAVTIALAGAPEGAASVAIPNGRHVVVVHFERLPTMSSLVQQAQIELESGIHRAVLEIPVASVPARRR